MKSLFSFLCVLFLIPAFSQIRIGIEAGYSRVSFNKDDVSVGDYYRNTLPLNAGHIGVISSIPFGQKFFLQPALLLTEKGGHKNEGGGFINYSSQMDIQIWYAELPVNILYSFAHIKKLQLSAGAGLYVSAGLWGREKGFSTGFDSLGMPGIYTGNKKVNFTSHLSDYNADERNAKSIDAGGNLLLQAELKNVFLNLCYSYGITKVIYPDYKNRVASVSAGYFLGRKRK